MDHRAEAAAANTATVQVPEPEHYHDLDAVLETALGLFRRGVADRRSAFHTPTIATLGTDGAPSLRTVVLRGFDTDARSLRFHTDHRSRKIAELIAEPRLSVQVYDPRAKIQVRLWAAAHVYDAGALREDAWRATRSFSRACYRTEPSPGRQITDPGGFAMDDHGDPETGFDNFRVVTAVFHRLEWLYLAAAGHRRAEAIWDADGAARASWLVP